VNVLALESLGIADPASILEPLLGEAVHVVAVSKRAAGAACAGNHNCPSPLKAGLRLYKSGTFACMSAFVMRWTTQYYLSTAGHCTNIGNVWQHPAGSSIGSATHQGWVANSTADVALIEIAPSQKGNQLCVFTYCSIITVTSRENPSLGQELIGESTCVAKQSSAACGHLISNNVTLNVCRTDGVCRVITFLRRTDVPVIPGDSGAPVYNSSRALGVISASYPGSTDSVYSHIINVEAKFGMATQLTP
jgi:hypothetical protein